MVNRVVLALVVLFALEACSKEACPKGQELREERFPNSTQARSRGCVGQDKEGNYLLQGAWEFFYENGQKASAGMYMDGNAGSEKNEWGVPMDGQVGLWVSWYRSGQKAQELDLGTERLITGRKDRWHENGQKAEEAVFKDGVPVGVVRNWYPNGQKEQEVTFQDGHPVRMDKWAPSGAHLATKTY